MLQTKLRGRNSPCCGAMSFIKANGGRKIHPEKMVGGGLGVDLIVARGVIGRYPQLLYASLLALL